MTTQARTGNPPPSAPARTPLPRSAGFSPTRTLSLAGRILRQFRRDPRSLALLFLAPLLVMTLLNFVLKDSASGVTLGIVAPDGAQGDTLYAQARTFARAQSGVTITRVARGDVDSTLKSGAADAVLIFPADLSGGAGAPAASPTVTLRVEGTNPSTTAAARQIAAGLVNAARASLVPSASAQPGASGQGSAGYAPAATLTLTTSYLYAGPDYTETDALAPIFIGLFAFFFVYLLASVAFLRERSQGTLERLMVSSLSRAELALGYVLGFMFFALLQSAIIVLFVVGVLRVHYAGNLGLIFLVTLALTVGAVNMGIFFSAFARNELQIIQFIPLAIVPQALLGGLFWPVAALPAVLKQVAYVMPLTYANFALRDVMLRNLGLEAIWPSLLFLVGFAALMVLGAAVSLRQERA